MMHSRAIWLAVMACTAAAACSQAPNTIAPISGANAFPFVLPWDASPTGSAADASSLNVGPAGKNGRIVVRQGKMFESGTGKRIKFFGTNVGASAAFPSKADAPKIARRMRVLGINLVRFHHLNNGWDPNGTIWKKGRTHIEIDPVQVDKMDWFIACLKKEGIYTNINLQTAREMVPELGFPESVRQIPNFQKKIDKVNRKMIGYQKEYAKDLLDRVNPYTKLKYKDDPALVKIEINNENSLVGWPGESPGAGLAALPSPFREEVLTAWNRWLLAKYKNDAGLSTAWKPTNTLKGPELATAANAWTYENQSNSDVTYAVTPDGKTPGELTATVKNHEGPEWHVQAHVPGLNLENGKTYTVSFEAWSDVPLSFEASARLDKSDWRFVGLASTVSTKPEWTKHHLVFNVSNTEPNHTRVGFTLGKIRGTVKFRGFSVREGVFAPGSTPGENLTLRNISIPPSDLSQRSQDWLQFLAETEAAYAEEMRGYLVKNLGFTQTFIIDTQVSWGGTTSFLRERNSPFRDDHQYWNHPTFLGGDWDPKNYRVERAALVNEFAPGKRFGTLGALSMARVAGIPHSVSEYNHPAPSDFQVEMMPLYAAWAARQDWDVIYTFAWDATGGDGPNNAYTNYFDMSLNPAKSAFFPMAARIFRSSIVPPAVNSMTLNLGPQPWKRVLAFSAAWPSTPLPLSEHRVGVTDKGQPGTIASTKAASVPFYRHLPGTGGSIVAMESPSFLSAVGFVGGKTVPFQGGSAQFGRFGADFAALTVNTLDNLPLARSPRILVTLGGRVENQGMGWNEPRNSVSDVWGSGPTMAEVVPVTLTLKVDGPRKVYLIGADHKRGKEVKATFAKGVLTIKVDKTVPSMWLEVVKA
jgi:hypothetical protein